MAKGNKEQTPKTQDERPRNGEQPRDTEGSLL